MRGDFPETVPYGYCHCGCDQKTKISPKGSVKRGWVRGEPRRFLQGHHIKGKFGADNPMWHKGIWIEKRRNGTSYIRVLMPEHPRSNSKGYVLEHILIAEKMIGEPLPSGAVVHHLDGNGENNNSDNLQICPSQAYHVRLHAGLRRLENGQR